MRLFKLIPILLITISATSCIQKEKKVLKLPYLFSDHMVLQQNEEVTIWGEYHPKDNVSVKGSWGDEVTTQTDKNGTWQVTIQTPEAGGPYLLDIITADSTIVLNDVMIGEVWLASGQSNMQMPLKGWPPNDLILNSATEISSADHSSIRMFTVPMTLSVQPLDDTNKSKWQVSSPETAADFSATAYFFAKRIQQELNVPVGIIHSSWGGTPAEAWTSEKSLRKIKDFDGNLDVIKNPEAFTEMETWFNQFASQEFPQTKEQWEQIEFADIDAAKPNFDDLNWSSIEVPGRVDLINNGNFDGAVWIRKEFEITDISNDYILKIASIDDMDATYINGQKVGGLTGNGFWNTPREMNISKDVLKKGTNVIAIRIIDTGGPGEINGPIELIDQNEVALSLAGTWKSLVIAEIYLGKFYGYGLKNDLKDRPDVLELNPHMPSVLYNAMINPLVPFTLKGAIWYQGESNVGRAEQYTRLFPAMIQDWREKWQTEFPFYFVQIAPFNYTPDPDSDISAILRDAQRHTLQTPKTGMAVTLDIGNINNIHPGNKQDVGSRLAGLALANDYGINLIPSGPLYKGMSRSGDKVILDFNYAENGLKSGEQGLIGFEIAGEDKVFIDGKAKIVKNQIELNAKGLKEPIYVRYAWRDNSIASLFNKEGLPASSFSTEK